MPTLLDLHFTDQLYTLMGSVWQRSVLRRLQAKESDFVVFLSRLHMHCMQSAILLDKYVRPSVRPSACQMPILYLHASAGTLNTRRGGGGIWQLSFFTWETLRDRPIVTMEH